MYSFELSKVAPNRNEQGDQGLVDQRKSRWGAASYVKHLISAHQLRSDLQALLLVFYIMASAASLRNRCKWESATVYVSSYLRYSFWNVVSLVANICSSGGIELQVATVKGMLMLPD